MHKPNRVHHIDALRAYAILMMLQGHFIYSLLAPSYRDTSNAWFNTWMFCKGFTAPIFFTVTGLVLVYLLLRKNDEAYQLFRIKKTFRRGIYLIFWGYLLRLNLFGLFKGVIYPSFWIIDVLHCIGIALIITATSFYLLRKYKIALFGSVLLSMGAIIFLFQPWYSQLDWSFLPISISNYLTKSGGSVFTPFPWLGYTLIGGALGVVYHQYIHIKWKAISVLAPILVVSGLLITLYSSKWLMNFHHLTGFELFKSVAYNNFLYIRFGHILIFIAGFMMLEPLFKRLPWFGKIGQKTLNIYIIHFVLLYGSWFGLGFARFWSNALTPGAVIGGAILFMISVTVLAFILDQIKAGLNGRKATLEWKPPKISSIKFIKKLTNSQ